MNDDQSSGRYGRDKVVKIITSVMDKVSEAEEISRETLYNDLKGLRQILDEAREDLLFVRPSAIQDEHIPNATGELDEIVKSTEVATSSIMDACEVLEGVADKQDDAVQSTMTAEITKIYEACSFQDLTGQRVSKIVKSLVLIDEKVTHMLDVIGARIPDIDDIVEDKPECDVDEGEALMNGPQGSDQAISQDEIDKLLADFD
jgi:chemotaxis protein CheZ